MKVFILFLLLFNYNLLHAQKKIISDTSHVDVRSFNNKELQKLKSETAFQYDRFREPQKGLWTRFWNWFWGNIREMLRTKNGRITFWTVLFLFGVSVIIFFVVKVMGMNKDSLFGRGNGKGLQYSAAIEDINNFNFEEAINDAIENRNFRLATRLLYLQSLKHLSDKGFIAWQINKTNTEYIVEVAGRPWQSLFKKLTYHFEYIWYGEMNLQKEAFQNLQLQFQQFNNQL